MINDANPTDCLSFVFLVFKFKKCIISFWRIYPRETEGTTAPLSCLCRASWPHEKSVVFYFIFILFLEYATLYHNILTTSHDNRYPRRQTPQKHTHAIQRPYHHTYVPAAISWLLSPLIWFLTPAPLVYISFAFLLLKFSHFLRVYLGF